MKITFLGTSHGKPEPKRATSSTAIQVGGSTYLIDAGAPVVNKMIDGGIDIESVRAVFITHTHRDHVSGLVDLTRVVNIDKIFQNAGVDYYFPEVNAIEALQEYSAAVMQPIRPEVNRFHLFDEGLVYEDENIKLYAIPTAHLKSLGRPSYAFYIECEGKRILFSGDLSQRLLENDFPKIASEKEIDLFVCELAHFDFDMLRPYLLKSKLKTVYFHHMVLHAERIPGIKQAADSGELPFEVGIANDGDVVYL